MGAYTIDEVRELVGVARAAKLRDPDGILDRPIEWLTDVANGVGPECMPDKYRKIITKACRSLQSTALIHDGQYALSDGTKAGQQKADDLFWVNGFLEIDRRYGFFNWRRYTAYRILRLAVKALRAFGHIQWNMAAEEGAANL